MKPVGSVKHSPLVASLFDGEVVAREHIGEPALQDLHADEAELVKNAVLSRQLQFAAGRHSARAAIAAIREEVGPVLWDAKRAPIWPRGIVGSITHTDDFCGAVIARQDVFNGIGIDAEARSSVGHDLWGQVLTTSEQNKLAATAPPIGTETATIIFSAKEAFYKAQYQLTGSWVGFEHAEVSIGEGEFTLDLLMNVGCLRRGDRFMGRYALLPALVLTGVAIPATRATGVGQESAEP